MAGVILETLSNRKLVIFGISLLLLQIGFFLLGALIAPAPSTVQQHLTTKCLDRGNHKHKDGWYYPRGKDHCESVETFEDPKINEHEIETNNIVFSAQIPHIRDNYHHTMSRWFQYIIGVVHVEIVHKPDNPQIENPVMTIEAKLSFQDKGEKENEWHEIAKSTEERPLKCIKDQLIDGEHVLDCEIIPLFELGSTHHDYYLINLRLPVHELTGQNMGLGHIEDVWIMEIHQNGGFTMVWFAMKTAVFPFILAVLVFYWRRVVKMERPSTLLERSLFGLGLAMTLLNFPLEWLTLMFEMKYMLLLTDIRQGIFYSMLLCFWIIFCGEHMMDAVDRNRLSVYWRHLGAVGFGCICLFVFEMCERGVQLQNIFYSIWSTDTGMKLALAFIILAGIAGCVYFLFLCYMIFKVFRNISAKRSSLPHMSKARRKYYAGLIYRFKFLMLVTLFCAAMTVIFFIISQVSEGHHKWGDENYLQYTSGFLTGVYGMWNLYVFSLLVFYAPSNKFVSAAAEEASEGETVEFSQIPSESSALTTEFTKPATD